MTAPKQKRAPSAPKQKRAPGPKEDMTAFLLTAARSLRAPAREGDFVYLWPLWQKVRKKLGDNTNWKAFGYYIFHQINKGYLVGHRAVDEHDHPLKDKSATISPDGRTVIHMILVPPVAPKGAAQTARPDELVAPEGQFDTRSDAGIRKLLQYVAMVLPERPLLAEQAVAQLRINTKDRGRYFSAGKIIAYLDCAREFMRFMPHATLFEREVFQRHFLTRAKNLALELSGR